MAISMQELNELSQEEYSVFEELRESGWTSDEAYEMIINNRETAIDDGQTDAAKHFAVTDMSSANWVLKQIANTQAELDSITEMVNAEILAIKKRAERITKPLERRLEFFNTSYGYQLQEFARAETEGKKQKSINLLYGKIGFRKYPDKVVMDVDEDEVIQELKRKGKLYCIRTSESIKHNEFAKTIPELAPGFAHIEPGEVRFYIKAELPE